MYRSLLRLDQLDWVGPWQRSCVPTVAQVFRKSEVNQLDMALCINEDVLRLHVTITNAFDIVKKLNDEDHLCGIEECGFRTESLGPS